MRCIQICDKVQKLSVWDVEGTGSRTTVNVSGHMNIEDAPCSLCGQCITHCPVGALRERDDTEKVWDAWQMRRRPWLSRWRLLSALPGESRPDLRRKMPPLERSWTL